METYELYNVTDELIRRPIYIMEIDSIDIESAFNKYKKHIGLTIRRELSLPSGSKIQFTKLNIQQEYDGYNIQKGYTTCSVEDEDGFTVDTFDYMIEKK